jgi:hypothetical protein
MPSIAMMSPISQTLLVMSCLQMLLRVIRPVKAIEPGIAVFAPEGIKEDKPQQRLEGNSVRTPYRIIALAFWAIWHHGNSVPRASRWR